MAIFEGRKAVLLDMNGTFMFGEDRFGPYENYFAYYQTLGGSLTKVSVNTAIQSAYDYLEERYSKVEYREKFPSVCEALKATVPKSISKNEIARLVETFAEHEIGEIDRDHVEAISQLATQYRLGAVIDIWSPKVKWESLFAETGIARAFQSISYSSDCGIVKPSPIPFIRVVSELGVSANEAIFVGDSIRRDLAGATAAGIDCILVGGARHHRAHASVGTFLELVNG